MDEPSQGRSAEDQVLEVVELGVPRSINGCCIDCGSGRKACDEDCIRKVAAMQCRATCGVDEAEQATRDNDSCVDECCKTADERMDSEDANLSDCNVAGSCCVTESTNKVTADKCCDGTTRPGRNSPKCSTTKDNYDAIEIKPGKLSRGSDSPIEESCCFENPGCVKNRDAEGTSCDSINTTDSRSKSSPSLCEAADACVNHLQRAFEEYSSYLRTGQCICRSVLDRLDKCCGSSVKQTCDSSIGTSSALPVAQKPLRRSFKKNCEEACCEKADGIKSGCGLDNITPARRAKDVDPDAIDTTAQKRTSFDAVDAPAHRTNIRVKDIDVENAAPREHVFLEITGMTCTGCSRKVTNVLNNINGISSVNVTFVTGVAEFDLDLAVAKPEDLIPRVERETGFKFTHVISKYQTLDLSIDPAIAKDVCEQLQDLVVSVEKLDKYYRISYDPTVIGARSLLASTRATLAPPGNDATKSGQRRLRKMAWSTGLSMILTIPVVVLAWSENPISYSTRSIVSLVLATGVQIIAVPEFYAAAIKSLIFSRILEMDMLIVISITAAYCYSVVAFSLTHAGFTLQTGEFFETSSLLITLVLLGRVLAAISKVRAISAVSLRSLQAEKVLLVDGESVEIDARLLQFGDVILIPAHHRVVTDGQIIHGQSTIDESMITGESIPIPKAVGDEVIAGTINGPSALTVRITRLPGKNSITDIACLVENALATKPRVQDLADRVATYFIPIVIAISVIVFVTWLAVNLRGDGGGAVGIAITYSIAVLAISCPCALGLAVPMVLVIAGGVAARSGVIIKQADVLESSYKVTDVVFDKTGTITKGLELVHEEIIPHPTASSSDLLSITKTLTKGSQHPVSLAVAARIKGSVIELDSVESIPGSGIQCTWKGSIVKAGNPYWLRMEHRQDVSKLLDQGMALLCVSIDSVLVAVFGLKSSVRDEASAVITRLHQQNIRCHLVSGDNPKAVEDVARTVGIPLSRTASRQSPAQKQMYVKSLSGVLFCGDGTNDAVAVAQANVGVQFGTASDVTGATADVVLLGGLDGLLVLLDLSRRCFRRIMFNFAWSAIYNTFAILLAAGAFVEFRIPPAYAGLGEIVSVGPVIIAAMTLRMNGLTRGLRFPGLIGRK